MRIFANMVIRNEADRYLEEVLDHLRPLVDEIILTDDCSDDNSVEIAKQYATVYQVDEPLFTKNEGLLRTIAWRNLQNHARIGDWILCIDADEKLWCTRPNVSLARFTGQPMFSVISIKFYHIWKEINGERYYRADKAWSPHGSHRFFRYYLGSKFKDKALAPGSEPMYVETLVKRGEWLKDTGLVMEHLGYLRDEDKKAKYDRYMELDGGHYHSLKHIESILDPNPVLMPWGEIIK